MDIHTITTQLTNFIQGDTFFYYHGITLAALWFIAANVAILLRKASTLLHGMAFFMIDVISLFFSGAAIYRVYPKLDTFASWPILVQGHVIGGTHQLIQAHYLPSF
jgi:hypothetical protein